MSRPEHLRSRQVVSSPVRMMMVKPNRLVVACMYLAMQMFSARVEAFVFSPSLPGIARGGRIEGRIQDGRNDLSHVASAASNQSIYARRRSKISRRSHDASTNGVVSTDSADEHGDNFVEIDGEDAAAGTLSGAGIGGIAAAVADLPPPGKLVKEAVKPFEEKMDKMEEELRRKIDESSLEMEQRLEDMLHGAKRSPE